MILASPLVATQTLTTSSGSSPEGGPEDPTLMFNTLVEGDVPVAQEPGFSVEGGLNIDAEEVRHGPFNMAAEDSELAPHKEGPLPFDSKMVGELPRVASATDSEFDAIDDTPMVSRRGEFALGSPAHAAAPIFGASLPASMSTGAIAEGPDVGPTSNGLGIVAPDKSLSVREPSATRNSELPVETPIDIENVSDSGSSGARTVMTPESTSPGSKPTAEFSLFNSAERMPANDGDDLRPPQLDKPLLHTSSRGLPTAIVQPGQRNESAGSDIGSGLIDHRSTHVGSAALATPTNIEMRATPAPTRLQPASTAATLEPALEHNKIQAHVSSTQPTNWQSLDSSQKMEASPALLQQPPGPIAAPESKTIAEPIILPNDSESRAAPSRGVDRGGPTSANLEPTPPSPITTISETQVQTADLPISTTPFLETDPSSAITGPVVDPANQTGSRGVELSPARAMPPAAITQQIATALATIDNGTIELSLNPEELGRVRLSLSTNEGQVSVSIIAERPETLEAIRRNLDLLSKGLEDAGYATVTYDFGGDTNGQNGSADSAFLAESESEPPDPEQSAPRQMMLRAGLDLKL